MINRKCYTILKENIQTFRPLTAPDKNIGAVVTIVNIFKENNSKPVYFCKYFYFTFYT